MRKDIYNHNRLMNSLNKIEDKVQFNSQKIKITIKNNFINYYKIKVDLKFMFLIVIIYI